VQKPLADVSAGDLEEGSDIQPLEDAALQRQGGKEQLFSML
jgi:hypothetical protein